MNHTPAFWSLSTTEILQQLQTTEKGLTEDEARQRLARYGSNLLKPPKRSDVLTLLLAQFRVPLSSSATNAVAKLLAIVQIKAAVLRDGGSKEISVEELVPGDIVVLNAGDIAPGDCLIQESKDFFVDEATLTVKLTP